MGSSPGAFPSMPARLPRLNCAFNAGLPPLFSLREQYRVAGLSAWVWLVCFWVVVVLGLGWFVFGLLRFRSSLTAPGHPAPASDAGLGGAYSCRHLWPPFFWLRSEDLLLSPLRLHIHLITMQATSPPLVVVCWWCFGLCWGVPSFPLPCGLLVIRFLFCAPFGTWVRGPGGSSPLSPEEECVGAVAWVVGFACFGACWWFGGLCCFVVCRPGHPPCARCFWHTALRGQTGAPLLSSRHTRNSL